MKVCLQKKKIFKKGAFSLIELIIVVLIIGIIYTLSVGNLESIKNIKEKPTLLTLKNYLSLLPKEKNAKLVCLNECRNCYIYIDEKLDEKLSKEFENFLDSSIEIYRYDFNLGMVELKNKVFFNSTGNEQEICFSYEVDKKGVGDQVIVKHNGTVYDFTQYFNETIQYSSLDNFIDAKEKQILRVLE